MSGLWGHIQKLRRNGGGTVLLKGFPGAGKTALLDRFAERTSAAGMVTLYATGCPNEQNVPLGVVEQWFDDGRGGSGVPSRLAALAQAYRQAASRDDLRDEERLMLEAQALVETALRDLAGQGPVVAVVDDAHHADDASLQILQFLAKRLVRLRVFIVLAGSTHPRKEYRAFQAAMMRNARLFVAELAALDPQDTARLLREVTGHPPTPGYVRDVLEVTAGNPRLLWAVAHDTLHAYPDVPSARWVPVTGAAFSEAVSLMVSAQHGECVEKVARALAVLGDARSPDLIARLIGVEPVHVATALDLLETTGLVTGGRFRHPAVRTAVLEDIGFTDRTELSRIAARLLYRGGAAPLEVARCITATGSVVADWEVSALREAARQAQSEGRWEEAVDLLELAQGFRGAMDDPSGLLVQTALAQWQLDPYTASRHLADLVDLGREGRLSARELTLLVQMLAWHGRLDDVDAVMALMRDRGEKDARAAVELRLVDALLSLVFTGHRESPAGRRPLDEDAGPDLRLNIPPWREVLLSLPALGGTGGDGSFFFLVDLMQQALYTAGDAEARVTDIVHCYFRLLHQVSGDWAVLPQIDAVSVDAVERLSPFHQLLLHCLQAISALAQGDLARAERKARAALDRPRAWGVAIGLPLSVLIVAMTRRGKSEEVAELLNTPVPSAMFTSHFGRLYLNARGMHYLSVRSHGAALSDFLGCGEAERQGGFPPVPACPWQAHAAEAYLLLGQRDDAVRLAEEASGTGFVHAKAIALRVLALAGPVERRGTHLREAMSLLEEAGERVELVECMVELGRTHHALGNARAGRSLIQRAVRAARTAGFEDALKRRLGETTAIRSAAPEPVPSPDRPAPSGPEPGPGPDGTELFTALSPAEQRVAWLAAVGYSNREIAAKLFVTVSTIEQHLTRIYRKLKVKHRDELATACPPSLDAAFS
ncbi:AAA family ATPase [Streptomyces sp. NPDC001388]|uniref:helix-turn-helix transcriptional regulator n=1 Tax=Streptomyces sp. NPDC001388 TaxID=3364568 RepID=UPI0036B4E25F